MKFFLIPLVTFCSCEMLKKYPQDNIVEEIVEDVIRSETGIDVDLSPATPEKK